MTIQQLMSNIGLLNGIAVWQVGNLGKKHGSYKMATTRENDALVLYKPRTEMSIAIHCYVVIPLIHHMFTPLFHQVYSNINTLWTMDWVVCNSVLMDHPEVQRNGTRITAVKDRATHVAAL